LTLKERFFGKITSKLKVAKTLKSVPNDYTCQYCKKTKPLTEEYFQKVKNFKYGFSTVCNECNKPKPKD
jgi:protein-disulfide isomerase